MASGVTDQDVKNLLSKCSNWERWGKADERGALNYITDQKRAAAAKLVRPAKWFRSRSRWRRFRRPTIRRR